MSLTPPPFTLTWAGKHLPDLHTPAALPLRETFAPLTFTPPYPLIPNAHYRGDNLPALTRLLPDGWAWRFRLIHSEPP